MDRVYFVQEGDDPAVKVGYSCDVEKRRGVGQVFNSKPLRVLGSIPGGREEEKACHRLLEEYHIRGDWFELTQRSRAIIDVILAGERYEHILGMIFAEEI